MKLNKQGLFKDLIRNAVNSQIKIAGLEEEKVN